LLTKDKKTNNGRLEFLAAFFICFMVSIFFVTYSGDKKNQEIPPLAQISQDSISTKVVDQKKEAFLEEALKNPEKNSRAIDILENKYLESLKVDTRLTSIRGGHSSKVVYFVEVDGIEKEVVFIREPKEPIPSQEVTLQGLAADKEVILESDDLESLKLLGELKASVSGSREVLVIIHNFADRTFLNNNDGGPNTIYDDSISQSSVQALMNTSTNSVKNFYNEVSYGALSVNATVTPILTSAHNFSTDGCGESAISSIATEAKEAASAADSVNYDPDKFDHFIYIFPYSSLCTYGGGTYAGLAEWPGDEVWINGSWPSRVFSHEIGHNYGLGHANYYDCGTVSIGPSCTSREYYDYFDTMGGFENGHFNASNKEYLGWMSGKIQAIRSEGNYALYPMSSGANNLKAIKIPIGATGKYYYVEYRQAAGLDSSFGPGGTRGAQIRIGKGNHKDTDIIDMTPQGNFTSSNMRDVALSTGQIFYDNVNGIGIEQTSATSSEVGIRISLPFNPSNLPVTTSLAFSSLSPAAGETLQASYRLKNISSVAVTIDAGLADQNTRTGQWNSFSPQRNITIEPGETRTFAFTKTVRFPGPHHTWIAIGQNGVWHNARPATNQLVNYSYTVQSPEKVVPVSASLAFSNLSPAAGETLDGGFTLRSNAKGSITVDVGFADYNTQSGKWNSFSPQRGITLSPGETRRLSFSKTSKFPGPHRTWIAIGHDGVWYDARPLTNQLTAYSYQVRNPRIEISKFFFNSVPPVLNQEFTATVAIKNLEPREIKMVGLGVPVFNSVNNTWRTLNSNITNFTLAPGETQNYTFRRTLTESGYYNIWPSYMVDDAWLTGTNQNGIFLFWSGWVR
jgi:M6 family metalloprotease-like protein